MTEGYPARLALCTGSDALAERFGLLLAHWAAEQSVALALARCTGLPGPGWDLVFLDADTAAVEGAGPERPPELAGAALVVISRRPRRAIAAHRWHAAAFLTPAAGCTELRRAMDNCFAAWRCGLQWLDLPARRERVRLPLCQLRYAEACGRESSLFCTGGCIQVSVPLKKLEEQLPRPPFFRCQKAFLVHLPAAESFAGGVGTMAGDGRQISVSRQQAAPLRQALAQWREEETTCISL